MSKNNDSSKNGSGIGFGSLLTLIFITLKLIGIIDWSWWWVLSPIWITTIIVVICITIFILAEK